MEWLKGSIMTIYPPIPKRCSQCGSLTQILHFFPEVLPLLNEDESVPSFCSGFCGAKFVIEQHSEKALMTCTIPKFLT